MDRTIARWFVGFVGFLSAVLVVFLAYDTKLSIAYLLGMVAGTGFGVSMIISQRRHANRGLSSEDTNRGWEWLLLVPVISATAAGLIRTLGSSDFQIFVLATTSSAIAVFVPWFVFVFWTSGISRNHHDASTTEAWRTIQERYAREEAEWRERQRRK